eukprot:TRINITY_DN23946_c0_g1_i1.p1 TRINITY_DN23946_c0_g1~~TRINITY_DN23946_c0_g1_i1.p1  ORF type:complete len:777 (+),score=302.60 TRINITY_DN23946_c0_g1_i1:91-2331(+)
MVLQRRRKGKQRHARFGGEVLRHEPHAAEQQQQPAAGAPAAASGSLFVESATIASLSINSRLREALTLQGFSRLTSVQQQAMGPMLGAGDVLIKSETGSGKTLAYVLPIAERILSWTAQNRISRDYGTIALTLTPTRELAEQSYGVLRRTLQKCPFIVPGCIMGGEQRKKEKARLRAGVHWLVATVGRLVDHLRTTQSFDCSKLKYVILDEADRLLDLGYEKDITLIKEALTKRGAPVEKSVLVSATLGEGIRRLSHFLLRDPVVVGRELRGDDDGAADGAAVDHGDATISVPPNLQQHYIVTPTKLRLVLLLSFLRWKIDALKDAGEQGAAEGNKIAVFFSSSDSVEFHYRLISAVKVTGAAAQRPDAAALQQRDEARREKKKRRAMLRRQERSANAHLDWDDDEGFQEFSDDGAAGADLPEALESGDEDGGGRSALVPFLRTNLFKLHGNMTQLDRGSVFEAMRRSPDPGVLLATDVASRGLDLPGVRWIVQYDPAGDEKSYTHRIGRTARAGRPGDAVLFVQPHEEPYVERLIADHSMQISRLSVELVLYQLARALGGTHLLECASQLHGACEAALGRDKGLKQLAAVAYQAYLRAYAAYPKHARGVFNVQQLHLGHLAKSFAVVKNPTRLGELARGGGPADGKGGASGYEPSVVRKRRLRERDAEGPGGEAKRPRLDPRADQQDARRTFRRPQAMTAKGQFSEFDTGVDLATMAANSGASAPVPQRKSFRPSRRKAQAGKRK